MAIHSLKRTQYIQADLPEIWAFFSNPDNLSKITPAYMNFRVTSPPHEGPIYAGQVITYQVSPIAGIPMSWMTEITQVQPMHLFVDEQRHGPYKIWHHQHMFIETKGGVLMTDIVHYKLPFFWLGDITHTIFIKRKVNSIFAHREHVIRSLFNTP